MKTKPMLSSDLIEAATMLLIAENCNLIEATNSAAELSVVCDQYLEDGRKAAAEYLTTCFAWAATAFEADEADDD